MYSYIVMLTLWSHILGDFILQPNLIFEPRRNYLFYIVRHTILYAIGLSLLLLAKQPFLWVLFNVIIHGFMDYITYKIFHWINLDNNKHKASIILSIDQGLHLTILYTSYFWFK